MATGTLGAFEATTTSRHGETAPAENMDLTGPGSSVLDGRHDEKSGRSGQNNEERPRTDDDWQTVLTLRQKKQQARERKSAREERTRRAALARQNHINNEDGHPNFLHFPKMILR
ncbi:hypothetical protein MTO96_037654 [Rhipicephalus appendiculatus]